ncbi:MAG: PTS sugar transporter subunit IIA [Clostridium sp.]|jgi:PTS system mannitol-specific IIA component|uniref:PTS sugar transporter subunit IIA n=1 Tax=Clostridium sp. TaxID=1506 RepID=UPI0025BF58DF|nr:PTS sugar transporter subunit IIA [Clostridium sp.]MCH3964833.1 PTS sugar transporter subunit IIA [Clostridium sp.]MCI1717385.1 PTS sugar transporter subunit IIA [Clostridium sp.]MCI1801725.1 PTS sugar transporter subunit IIA [Clostridium sp.]MCI1814849.1 PTS sugar transporter subunit IIA [Clostridium sp.]MCI1872475.1 PTS sugar transporter subunit IIA [Clostridium sp.]
MEPEVLCENNILLNVKSESKNEAIRRVGNLLVQNGYVDDKYIEGMIKRNEDISTYIGNGVAIPHGMNEYVKYIRHSGIVIAQYRDGVDFGEGNTAYLVIGIAGKNDDHMNILSKIAIVCQYDKNVKKLVKSDDKKEIIRTILEEE